MQIGKDDTEIISVLVIARKGREYRYFPVEPKECHSLYWSREATERILANFYEHNLPTLWNDQGTAPLMENAVARFRSRYPGCEFAKKKLCDDVVHEAVTGAMIRNLWEYGHPNGPSIAKYVSGEKTLFAAKEAGDDCGDVNRSFSEGTPISDCTMRLTMDNDKVIFSS